MVFQFQFDKYTHNWFRVFVCVCVLSLHFTFACAVTVFSSDFGLCHFGRHQSLGCSSIFHFFRHFVGVFECAVFVRVHLIFAANCCFALPFQRFSLYHSSWSFFALAHSPMYNGIFQFCDAHYKLYCCFGNCLQLVKFEKWNEQQENSMNTQQTTCFFLLSK